MSVPCKVMSAQEARSCIDQINNNLRNTRALLLDLYEREGWKALGYDSWRACVTGEFKEKQSYLYYQLEAAKAERNISTMVETAEIGNIPERVLRPLTSLSPDLQREAYQKAVETAPEGKVTARHVEEVVRERWGMTKSRANQLISASEVADNLTTIVVKDIPERHLRRRTVSTHQADSRRPGDVEEQPKQTWA